MIIVSTPDASNSSSFVTLGGELYTIRYNFNGVDKVWRIDLYYQNKLIIASLDLKLGTLITGKYDLPEFDHGELFLAKVKATAEPPIRDNVGVGRAYELIYVTNKELGR